MRRWAPPLASSDRPLAIIGTDDKARRIACLWASAGHDVNIQDPDHSRCKAALRYIPANASNFAKLLGRKSFQVGKCQIFADLTAVVKDAWLVIGACQGVRHPVADLLGQIDWISPSDCILVSASSSSVSSSSSNLTFNKIDVKRRSRTCCANYSFLPRNCVVELLPGQETDQAILSFLVGHHEKIGTIASIADRGSKGMVMDRIWAALKREILAVLAEGLEQIAEADDEDIRDLTLDSTVASDYLRKKYIQQGRGGTENVKDEFDSRRSCNAVANGHLFVSAKDVRPTNSVFSRRWCRRERQLNGRSHDSWQNPVHRPEWQPDQSAHTWPILPGWNRRQRPSWTSFLDQYGRNRGQRRGGHVRKSQRLRRTVYRSKRQRPHSEIDRHRSRTLSPLLLRQRRSMCS